MAISLTESAAERVRSHLARRGGGDAALAQHRIEHSQQVEIEICHIHSDD